MHMKEKIEDVWQCAAQLYNDHLIQEQFASFQKKAWLDLIAENLPRKGRLRILDVGTGPGFFAIILSLAGHEVTGIDCTEAMLEQAKLNARREGGSPEFLLGDSHYLDFADETFDVVINRNVVWTLYEPKRAYAEWRRVLKKKGRLIVFDANWFRRLYEPSFLEEIEQAKEVYRERFGACTQGIMTDKMEQIVQALAHSHPRPEWDVKLLTELGYQKVYVDADIAKRIYDEKQLIIGRLLSKFMICADK